jgi:hypothetical protein
MFSMKFINFKHVISNGNKVACLVDNAALAQLQQLLRLRQQNFFFPFKTADSTTARHSLNGYIAPIAFHSHANGAFRNRRQITLRDADTLGNKRFKIPRNNKFTFYFLRHNLFFHSS